MSASTSPEMVASRGLRWRQATGGLDLQPLDQLWLLCHVGIPPALSGGPAVKEGAGKIQHFQVMDLLSELQAWQLLKEQDMLCML